MGDGNSPPPHQAKVPRVRMMINDKVLDETDPTPTPHITIRPPSGRRGSAVSPQPPNNRRGSGAVPTDRRRGSTMLSISMDTKNTRRGSGEKTSSSGTGGPRRASLFPVNQHHTQAKSRWSKLANLVSPTSSFATSAGSSVGGMGTTNARRGSMNPAAAILLAARKSTSAGTFDAFMSRVVRRRSSGKVNLRRGSLFSTGSDSKKEPEKPSVDTVS